MGYVLVQLLDLSMRSCCRHRQSRQQLLQTVRTASLQSRLRLYLSHQTHSLDYQVIADTLILAAGRTVVRLRMTMDLAEWIDRIAMFEDRLEV